MAPVADVYHGHDLPGLGVADAARSAMGGRVVYDSHDLFVESGANARRPRWTKRAISTAERALYRRADHLITVNSAIAERLHQRYGTIPTSIVHNCVPRWVPSDTDRQLLRQSVGVPAGTPLVLYHGGFSANRGLGLLVLSMQEPALRHAHLVLLGYGPMEAELRRMADLPAVRSRVHVVAAVPPDVLDRYVSGADVVAMVNQPVSENEVLSTPNKLFEALGAGVPIVTSDFPLRRQIVLEDRSGPLGAVCDPTDPRAIAGAIAGIVTLPSGEREALQAACLASAHSRWNWEVEEESLRGAYEAVMRASPTPSSLAADRKGAL